MAVDTVWRITVEVPGLGRKTFGMQGPATAEAAKAEFERQQRDVNSKGVPFMPPGEVLSVEPGDTSRKPAAMQG
jgi:hypothetical protein